MPQQMKYHVDTLLALCSCPAALCMQRGGGTVRRQNAHASRYRRRPPRDVLQSDRLCVSSCKRPGGSTTHMHDSHAGRERGWLQPSLERWGGNTMEAMGKGLPNP